MNLNDPSYTDDVWMVYGYCMNDYIKLEFE